MRTIWITGGSSGIGFASAKKFLENNWVVIISSSNIDKLNNAKERMAETTKVENLHVVKCDISNKAEVEKTVLFIENEIEKIDIAILNAAAYSPNKNQDFDLDNYELLIDVNLKGTLYCINALKDVMKGRSNTIAIVSSPVGYRGLPTAGAYGLTKAGLTNLAESLYFDLSKMKINISIINPGFIKSESTNLNSFPMPFLKTSNFAANKIYKGLTGRYKFEIFFPWFFLMLLKIFRILPYKIYFYLIKKITKF